MFLPFCILKEYWVILYLYTVELVQSDICDIRQKIIVPKYFC